MDFHADMKLKVVCAPIFVAACILLYMGTTMLFLVPGSPGESYLQSLLGGRFFFGVVPAVASVILLFVVGWLWNLSKGSPDIILAVARTFFRQLAQSSHSGSSWSRWQI
jgi:hypothetical protein